MEVIKKKAMKHAYQTKGDIVCHKEIKQKRCLLRHRKPKDDPLQKIHKNGKFTKCFKKNLRGILNSPKKNNIIYELYSTLCNIYQTNVFT